MDREFVDWFHDRHCHQQQQQHQQRPGWDNTSHISMDDDIFSEVLSTMSPVEGTALLGSISVINYRQAWWLLQHMVRNVEYRQKVLHHFQTASTNVKHFGFDVDPSNDTNLQAPSQYKTTPSGVATASQKAQLCAQRTPFDLIWRTYIDACKIGIETQSIVSARAPRQLLPLDHIWSLYYDVEPSSAIKYKSCAFWLVISINSSWVIPKVSEMTRRPSFMVVGTL